MIAGLWVNRSDWFTHDVLTLAAAVLIILVVVAQTIVLSEPLVLELLDQSTRNADVDQNIEARCEELAGLYRLSEREREVMALLAQGMSYGHIEKELFISLNTVKSHASRIYRKLGVSSRQELIDFVRGEGE